MTLRDSVLERLSTALPASVPAAFERAAADELLRVREEALAAMRNQGVIVVDARPELAAQAVVERYVQLKRRALI